MSPLSPISQLFTNLTHRPSLSRRSYESALKSLHAKNFAHNNITREHVLLHVTRGEASLISLKNCEALDPASAPSYQERDITTMHLCLGRSSEAESSDPAEEVASGRMQVPKRGKGSRKEGRIRNQSNAFDFKASW